MCRYRFGEDEEEDEVFDFGRQLSTRKCLVLISELFQII